MYNVQCTILDTTPPVIQVTGRRSEVTSGGNLINPTHRDYAEPTNNPDRWTVTVTNPGPNPIDIRAFAVCAKLVDVP